jgi:hypothetical protein
LYHFPFHFNFLSLSFLLFPFPFPLAFIPSLYLTLLFPSVVTSGSALKYSQTRSNRWQYQMCQTMRCNKEILPFCSNNGSTEYKEREMGQKCGTHTHD